MTEKYTYEMIVGTDKSERESAVSWAKQMIKGVISDASVYIEEYHDEGAVVVDVVTGESDLSEDFYEGSIGLPEMPKVESITPIATTEI